MTRHQQKQSRLAMETESLREQESELERQAAKLREQDERLTRRLYAAYRAFREGLSA